MLQVRKLKLKGSSVSAEKQRTLWALQEKAVAYISSQEPFL